MKVLGWLWYVVVQLIMELFMVLGWLLLIPFCLAHAWVPWYSPTVSRTIDVWSWFPLNKVYGNLEDGVSGQQALIWLNGTTQAPYDPPIWHGYGGDPRLPLTFRGPVLCWLWSAWRAYCWSGWRNSCDGLKYVFAWENGPQATLWGHKLGWWLENGKKVPLL